LPLSEIEWSGEVYYVNKGNVLAPWLALAAAIIAGGIILRRRQAYR